MARKKSKAIVIGKSKDVCKKCRGEMVTKKHPKITDKLRNQYYYFKQWDYCRNCNKVYFDERYRVVNRKAQPIEEQKAQEAFFFNITDESPE